MNRSPGDGNPRPSPSRVSVPQKTVHPANAGAVRDLPASSLAEVLSRDDSLAEKILRSRGHPYLSPRCQCRDSDPEGKEADPH